MPGERDRRCDWEVAGGRGLHEIVAARPTAPRRPSSATACTSTSRASRPTGGTSTASASGDAVSAGGTAAHGARRTARSRRSGSASPPASTTSRGSSRRSTTSPRERCDLVTHLGDYIYEYGRRGGCRASAPRLRDRRRSTTIARATRQYKLDPALQAAHAACPWIVTWDDHEVDNNYAGRVRRERLRVGRADARAPRGRATRPGGSTSRCACRAPARGPISTSTRTATGARSRASGCSTRASIAATRPAATDRRWCRAASGPIRAHHCSGASRSGGSSTGSAPRARDGRCSRSR